MIYPVFLRHRWHRVHEACFAVQDRCGGGGFQNRDAEFRAADGIFLAVHTQKLRI